VGTLSACAVAGTASDAASSSTATAIFMSGM
jgi:hypothetical protein